MGVCRTVPGIYRDVVSLRFAGMSEVYVLSPVGYNIDHVYQLSMIKGGESRDSSMTNADKYLGILQKLEREPAVEVAALSYWSLPMSGNNSYNSLAVQDTIGCELRIINATGGYTRVFRMKERCLNVVCGNA